MHRSATAPSPRPAPPPSSTPSPKPSPPVLLTEGVCCCCGTTLRYPRASPSFRCTVCDTVTDLDDKARKGKAREGALRSPLWLVSALVAHTRTLQARRYPTRPPSPKRRSLTSCDGSRSDEQRQTPSSRTGSALSNSSRRHHRTTTLKTRCSRWSRRRSTTCRASRGRSALRSRPRRPRRPDCHAAKRSLRCTTLQGSGPLRSICCEARWTRSCAGRARLFLRVTGRGSSRSSRCVLLPPLVLTTTPHAFRGAAVPCLPAGVYA